VIRIRITPKQLDRDNKVTDTSEAPVVPLEL
jgi:hypothetical protein